MDQDIATVLIDRHAIATRVAELAGRITADIRADLAKEDGDGRNSEKDVEITLVPILSGSFMFVADLIRHLPLRMQIRMLAVSSYPGKATETEGSTVKRELTNLPETLAGCHVLLIDDILDSGGTLKLAADLLREREPASLRTCVLLRKKRDTAMHVPVDYVAFDIPDEFIVGYGLDYNDFYRNLPDIVTLRPEVFQ